MMNLMKIPIVNDLVNDLTMIDYSPVLTLILIDFSPILTLTSVLVFFVDDSDIYTPHQFWELSNPILLSCHCRLFQTPSLEVGCRRHLGK